MSAQDKAQRPHVLLPRSGREHGEQRLRLSCKTCDQPLDARRGGGRKGGSPRAPALGVGEGVHVGVDVQVGAGVALALPLQLPGAPVTGGKYGPLLFMSW